jgi:hypothetical protein
MEDSVGIFPSHGHNFAGVSETQAIEPGEMQGAPKSTGNQ